MAAEFPSDDWIKRLMTDLNQSASYQEAAKNWEGDFVFYIEPGGTLAQTMGLYMDLFHGKCREAYALQKLDQLVPAFKLSGPVGTWERNHNQKTGPDPGYDDRTAEAFREYGHDHEKCESCEGIGRKLHPD